MFKCPNCGFVSVDDGLCPKCHTKMEEDKMAGIVVKEEGEEDASKE